MSTLIVDPPSPPDEQPRTPEDELVGWVIGRVNRWREYRDRAFQQRWGEYYRLWRGRWSPEDRNRQTERSRLIAPALSQAIEMTHAEMEEATFGRGGWLDLADDVDDQEKQDMLVIRDRLLEDLETTHVPDAISDSYLNGNLYGNGIAKIRVEITEERALEREEQGGALKVKKTPKVRVFVDAIPADEFIPDPSGTRIEEMLGCAHEVMKPLSWVRRKQQDKVFRDVVITPLDTNYEEIKAGRSDLEEIVKDEDLVLVTEYHGLVPARMLAKTDPRSKDDPLSEALALDEPLTAGGEALVEAIVTIGNKGSLLRAKATPFVMGDRSFVSYQHQYVPGRFWGRGTAEKGFNPQKALDGELRARADALAFISNPMMAADITRLPRGFDMAVHPGKLWLTNGAPKEIMTPFQFQGLDPNTFNQSGEMERMVQMGTGAMDTATPIRQNRRNETATGSSMMVGSFVKRSKLSMNKVTRNFLDPLIRKILWRYMQFDPERYPSDFKFRVVTGMGIVAKEIEQNQLTQMLGLVPDNSPAKAVLIKAIFDNSASPLKAEMVRAAEAMMAGPSPEEQAKRKMAEELAIAEKQADISKKQMEASKLQAQTLQIMIETQRDNETASNELQIELARVQKEFMELSEMHRQNTAALLNAQANLIKATRGGNSNGSSTSTSNT